jgi:hypothetical protein
MPYQVILGDEDTEDSVSLKRSHDDMTEDGEGDDEDSPPTSKARRASVETVVTVDCIAYREKGSECECCQSGE